VARAIGGGLNGVPFPLGVVDARATVGGTISVFLGGTIHHGGSLTLQQITYNEAVAIGEALAVGPVGGTGVSAKAQVTPTISTFVSPHSNITVDGDFTIRTQAEDAATAEARGIAGAPGFAIGVSLADAVLAPTISTYIGSGATINAGGAITIETLHNVNAAGHNIDRRATADAEASAGSFIGGGAGADADAEASATVQAYVASGASLSAGPNATITIRALSNNVADADAQGIVGGIASVGAMLSEASVAGATSAYVGDQTTVTAKRLDVLATDTNTATPTTLVVGVGGITGAGAKATGTISRTTEAYIGTGADIALGTGTLNVHAISEATSAASATGAVGGGIGVSALIIDSTTDGTTRAYVGDGTTVAAGQLNLTADATSLAKTPSQVVGVGLLAGTGIGLTATDTSTVEAYIGPHTGSAASGVPTSITITGGGVDVDASSTSTVEANTDVVSVGLLGVAGSKSSSTSAPTVQAYLGDQAEITALSGAVTFAAEAQSSAVTQGTGLAAGAIAASFIDIEAEVTPTVSVFTESGGSIAANTVSLVSTSTADVDVSADGTITGKVAVGVMQPEANLVNRNSATLGDGTTITARLDFTLQANSTNDADADADGTTGGIISVVEATTT
jgi:hypothetical protein